MRIVIHGGFLSGQYTTGSALFMHELILEMAKRNGNHAFMYLFHKPLQTGPLPGNVSVHLAGSRLAKWLGTYGWNRWLLPYALRKLKADLVIAVEDGHINTGRVPCCLFVLNQQPAPKKRLLLPERTSARRLRAISLLISFSEHDRESLLRDHALSPEKVKVLHVPTPGSIRALTYPEKEAVREQFAAGLEYFLFAGDIAEHHDLLELLKAFAQFKKWQQSNMQLLIAGSSTRWTEQLLQKLASFKYRNDVHVLPDLPEADRLALIGAAYALVYPALTGHFPLNILLAMQAEVPVITSETGVIRELAGDAVLYAASGTAQGFSFHMRQLFKDEHMRAALIAQAKQQRAEKGARNPAEECWRIMMQAFQP